MPRRCIPDEQFSSFACRGEAMSVGAERHACDTSRMATEREDFKAGRCVPQLDRSVVARRCNPLSVRAERDAHNPAGMATQPGKSLPGICIPDIHFAQQLAAPVVVASRRNPLSVAAERNALDASRAKVAILCGSQREDVAACRSVPRPNCAIATGRRDVLSVGAERHAFDVALVTKASPRK